VLVATLKVPVATCGDWRQGWTTLLYSHPWSFYMQIRYMLAYCFDLEYVVFFFFLIVGSNFFNLVFFNRYSAVDFPMFMSP